MDIHKHVGKRKSRPSWHLWRTPCEQAGCESYALSGLQHCRWHALPSEEPVNGLRTALDRELGIKAHNALKRLSESRMTIEATRRRMAEELTAQILTDGPTTPHDGEIDD